MISDAMKQLASRFRNKKCFDRVLENIQVLKLADGVCECELKIEEGHSNKEGALHNGFAITMMDSISSWALASHSRVGFNVPHVSQDLHASFTESAKVGESILIQAKALKVGKTIGVLDIEIHNKSATPGPDSATLLMKGRHTKFILRGKTFT